MILEGITDALIDSLKLLPYLFVTYFCMELLEKKQGEKLERIIRNSEKSGPVWGAVLGVVPQCGFSASAASFYAGGVINTGTLLAIFMSTSDEMLPIFVSQSVAADTIIKVLVTKVVIAIITGYIAGTAFEKLYKLKAAHVDIHAVCEHEHCNCSDGVFKSAIKHTVKIAVFILILSSVMNILIGYIGEETLVSFCSSVPIVAVLVAALIGLIPNCAASVLLAQMYLEGLISSGAMLAGLLVGAGVGLLILFRLENDKKKCAIITALLYICGVFWGVLADMLGIVF